MNPFDASIMKFVNGYAHISPFFDTLIYTIMENGLVKGGFIMSLVWFVWFKNNGELRHNRREIIIATIMGTLLGVLIVRGIEHFTILRVRPILNAEIQFITPYGISDNMLAMWHETWYTSTSFPSDHATLFFGLATGFLFVSRPLGLFILSYVVFVISLPRIYMGVHYPSDIIIGGLIGGCITCLFNIPNLRNRLTRPAIFWYQKSPATFYLSFFLFSFEVASLFSGIRQLWKFFS